MAPPRKAIVPVLSMLVLLFPLFLSAQSSSPARDLKDGIDLFRNGQYDKAILLFNTIITDPSAAAQKPDAYFLAAKSYIAISRLDEAERSLEYYIANFPRAADYPEALYQRGRLLYLQQDLPGALQSLQLFIASYPRSAFVSSAWFWAGESLYGLGRLDDALAVYQKIVDDYPSSVKLEAAQYKVSLIQLQKKEVELAKLLKWSHEDFLKTVEDYQNRERAYEQAIEAYQKRLAGSGAEEDQKTIAGLKQDLAAKTEEATRLAVQLAAAGVAPAAASGSTESPAAPADQQARIVRLLTDMQQALALKQKLLAWLQANGGQ